MAIALYLSKGSTQISFPPASSVSPSARRRFRRLRLRLGSFSATRTGIPSTRPYEAVRCHQLSGGDHAHGGFKMYMHGNNPQLAYGTVLTTAPNCRVLGSVVLRCRGDCRRDRRGRLDRKIKRRQILHYIREQSNAATNGGNGHSGGAKVCAPCGCTTRAWCGDATKSSASAAGRTQRVELSAPVDADAAAICTGWEAWSGTQKD